MEDNRCGRAVDVIINECSAALHAVDGAEAEALARAIQGAERVFFIGVGRVMLALECMAKRLAHCGVPAVCVGQITEPAITRADLLIAASGSGESLIPVTIARKAKSLGAEVAWIGSNAGSTLASLSDIRVRIPVQTKLGLPDELRSAQPMTSLFEQSLLLLGDAVAQLIIWDRKLHVEELWQYHANLE